MDGSDAVNPNSKMFRRWRNWTMFLVFYTTFFTPYRIAFESTHALGDYGNPKP